jgi:hypothetical protein
MVEEGPITLESGDPWVGPVLFWSVGAGRFDWVGSYANEVIRFALLLFWPSFCGIVKHVSRLAGIWAVWGLELGGKSVVY